MSMGLRAIVLTVGLLAAGAAAASGINGINNGMPNRISMNVTVAKQTPNTSFGEKVNAGLHAAGSALAQGASLTVVCGATICVVALPDGSGYRADLNAMTLTPLDAGQAMAALPADAAASGAGIVSAAVSSVGNLSGQGGGAAAASYARTASPAPLASRRRENGDVDITEPMGEGDYVLSVVVQPLTQGGLKDTLKTQVRMAAPGRVRIDMAFSSTGNVLKTKHDTAKNAIGNIR